MRRPGGAVLIVACLAVLTACGSGASSSSATQARDKPPPHKPGKHAPAGGAPVRVVVAGDLACAPGSAAGSGLCQQRETARLAARLHPDAALLTGDLQYDTGAADEWSSFDASWGRLPFPLYPAPGNHEYGTPRAAAYYDHFGARAGPGRRGWYAFDLGAWRAYSLNSNCAQVGCGAGSAQERWLRADLAANPRACVLAYWHHPRFSSGLHGDEPLMTALWTVLQNAGADLALEGHDHDYQRFARRTADGAVDPVHGIASFVTGTGGKSHYPVLRSEPGSQKVVQGRFGLLELALSSGSWRWTFRTNDGRVADSGAARCQ